MLTTKAEYASGPPPGYRVAASTDSYELWEKNGTPLGREPGERDQAPGRTDACPPQRPALASSFAAQPVVADDWSSATVESGDSATIALDLPPGDWDLSLQYDATRPVTLSAPGLHSILPGNLDYRGTAPYWPAGSVESDGGAATIIATVARSAACRAPARRPFGRPPRGNRGDQHRAPPRRVRRLRRLVRALMDLSFGEALLIFGSLLAVVAALSGLMRGTVLSASVLSIALGIVLAELDVVSVDVGDEGIVELIELALILTLVSDGLLVDRELLGRHWGPPARALVVAMPITLAPAWRSGRSCSSASSAWAEAFLLGAVLCATDPVVTSAVVTSRHVPSSIRHTLNLESGLNDGLALPFVLFFLVLASPGGDAGQRGHCSWSARRRSGRWSGPRSGLFAGWLHRVVPRGITGRYEGIYAIGFGLAAFGLADVTFGNGLIAAFVLGITLGLSEREITERFADFSENVSAIFQVLTFFVFGALIVATGYDGAVVGAARVHRLRAAGRAPGRGRAGTRWDEATAPAQGVHRLVRAQGRRVDAVCAARPRRRRSPHRTLIFDVASFVILASIIAHGLTDTVGARWIARRMQRP